MNATEQQFRVHGGNRSQCDRILELLLRRSPDWVPMPDLARAATPTGIGCPVHSRINDIRTKYGYNVEHRNRWIASQCHSYYRLPSRIP
jgi:hypothetical protein